MILFIINHPYHYESENILREFFQTEEIKRENTYHPTDEDNVITSLSEKTEGICLTADVNIGGKKSFRSVTVPRDSREKELTMARCLYECLTEVTGYTPPWGLLTGVRPSKLMNKCISEMGREKAVGYFTDRLSVRREKAELAANVAAAQEETVAKNSPDSFSLYISIPFCPGRCSYCSFVSHSITNPNAKKLLLPYLENLKKEISVTAEKACKNGLSLRSVYFGGGTPGILSSEQSKELLNEIKNSFDMSRCDEITFEAGRADTITEEKLIALKKSGVDRISVNPQTYNDEVLREIGRNHTSRQVVDALKLARKIGFSSINTDLIAGLPGGSCESFRRSVDISIETGADNITVHSLALKRASGLVTKSDTGFKRSADAAKMLDYSSERLTSSGFIPYYMYRQSRCIGNLENVGWCLKGKECLYNIYMMEEIHTVLACGAGAVTRLKNPYGGEIERIFNFKYPYEYNARFDEILNRKSGIDRFMSIYGEVNDH